MASLALYWSVMIACYLLASRLRRYADRLGFVNTLLSVSVYALVFVLAAGILMLIVCKNKADKS